MKDLAIYLLIIGLLSSCAGAYYDAERYSFDMSRTELISKIEEFKELKQEYQPVIVENDAIVKYPEDHRQDLFYGIYFYLPDKKMIVHTVINMSEQIEDIPVILMLTGVTKNKNLGGWRTINTNELDRKENKKIKKVFETEILNYLGDWKRKRLY